MNSDFPAAPPNMILRYGSVAPVAAPALICGMFMPSYECLDFAFNNPGAMVSA